MIGRALERDPMNPVYNCNFATVLLECGETGAAIDHFRKALAAQPDYLDAHFNLGNALLATGRHDAAADHYRQALRIRQNHVLARNNLALCFVETGRLDDAISELETSLRIDPELAETHANLAVLLQMAGRIDDALAEYDEALRRAPDDAEIRNNHGAALALAGRPADAEREYLAALELEPGLPDAHLNIGELRRDERKFDQAETAYRRAIALDPDHAPAHNNLGALLSAQNRYAEAEVALQRALSLRPNYIHAYKNLALAGTRAGRFDEARAYCDRALALSPDDAEIRFVLGCAELATSRFETGWCNYLSRQSMASAPADVWRRPLPRDLSEKRILVGREQGVGDEIFYARFLAQLGARGGEIFCHADARLVSMFERAGIAPHVHGHQTGGEFDFRISAGDLPYLLEMKSPGEIPPSIRIPALPEKESALARRLEEFGPPPYVGVTWRAGVPDRPDLLYKEFPPALMARALAPIDVRVIVLQRQPAVGEVAEYSAALGRPVCDLSALNADLEDMLGLVGLLDDYVCVSNTNAHLAAARDHTCRVLIPIPPEFRWMATGDESPWFPGTRLYRQGADGDWSRAFDALQRDLEAAFPSG